MVDGLILAIGTGLIWSVVGIFFSRIARRGGDVLRFQLIISSIIALQAWAVCDWKDVLSGNIPAAQKIIPIMVSSGIVGCMGMLTLILAMRRGHQAITWTIGQSAMAIPFLAGLLLWREPANTGSLVGMALIVVGIALFGRRREETQKNSSGDGWFTITLLAFLTTGLSQAISTIPSYWPGWVDEARLRVPLGSSGSLITLLVINLFRRGVKWNSEWRLAVPCAMIAVFGQFGLYASMDKLAEVNKIALVYPLCTAVCVLGFAVYSRVRLKERLGLAGCTAFLLCLAGIVMMRF